MEESTFMFIIAKPWSIKEHYEICR